jgi:hypothetical protein
MGDSALACPQIGIEDLLHTFHKGSGPYQFVHHLDMKPGTVQLLSTGLWTLTFCQLSPVTYSVALWWLAHCSGFSCITQREDVCLVLNEV